LPSTDWKRAAYKNREQQRWYAGETISIAVGQGYNSFTLMQLAQATAVLANDGVYMKPHLVRTIKNVRTDEQIQTVVEAAHKIALKKENLQVVKRALTEVTVSGTAAGAFVGAPYTTAGKTGTAQVYSLRGAKYQSSAIDERLRDHSLFMAFAPATQPKIAIAVIVENAGWGGSVAAPIARKVFDTWLLREAKTLPSPSNTPPARRTEVVVPEAARVAAVPRVAP
jgi:penicillin-binding protein 2